MLCESFLNLNPLEQSTYIGKIVHLVSHDEQFYNEGLKLLKRGERKGIFNGVIINPINEGEQHLTEIAEP